MNVKIVNKDTQTYEKLCKLRYEVFYKINNSLFDIVFDELEDKSIYFVIDNDSLVMACCRLTEIDDSLYKISQMAVKERYRKYGYGSEIMKAIIEYIIQQNGKLIELDARISVIEFYRKFQFVPFGNEFFSLKTGVRHIKMRRKI